MALSALAATAAVPATPSAECVPATKSVTELGTRTRDEEQLSAGRRSGSVGLPARHVRVLVKLQGAAPAAWSLVVRDAEYRVVQVLRPEDFGEARGRWTLRVPGGIANFDLYGSDLGDLTVRLLDFVVMPAEAKSPFYSARDSSDPAYESLHTAGTDPNTRRLGDPVGLLTSSWGRSSWCCSGVLVAPDLFLTNWHCGGPNEAEPGTVWHQQVCDGTFVDVSWDGDDRPRDYECVEVVEKDRELDFAILRVRPTTRGQYDRPATIADALASPGPVRIIHHPKCLPKQLSSGCNVLEGDHPNWLAEGGAPDAIHDCDTERGSSGAPVFDAQGRLIALHHRGYDFDDDCKPKAYENKAVRASDILSFLRERNSPVLAEIEVR